MPGTCSSINYGSITNSSKAAHLKVRRYVSFTPETVENYMENILCQRNFDAAINFLNTDVFQVIPFFSVDYFTFSLSVSLSRLFLEHFILRQDKGQIRGTFLRTDETRNRGV